MKRGKKVLLICVLILLIALLAIQFVPVNRSNPPTTAPLIADAAVLEVLQRACYDCHSNETVWPWYSYAAPASWLVARDVEEARGKLNFSEWGSYPTKKQIHKAEEVYDEVSEGEMPLKNYLLMHPDAHVSGDELSLLRNWMDSLGGSDLLDGGMVPDGEHGADDSGMQPSADADGDESGHMDNGHEED